MSTNGQEIHGDGKCGAVTKDFICCLEHGHPGDHVQTMPPSRRWAVDVGQKHDQEKNRWDLLPIGPIRDVVKVLTKGAIKYSAGNWAKVPDARNRYYSAAMRHITAWFEGEKLDPEWNLPHLAHATCCLIFLAWFDQNA